MRYLTNKLLIFILSLGLLPTFQVNAATNNTDANKNLVHIAMSQKLFGPDVRYNEKVLFANKDELPVGAKKAGSTDEYDLYAYQTLLGYIQIMAVEK